MRLIDADALTKEHCEGCSADVQAECKIDPLCGGMMWLVEAPTVDAVEVDAIQAWLYEIAMNNTGDVSRVCEALISRLDGLRVFAKERRTNEG